ncbi:MAG: hypothetical protein ACLP9L_23980 [Thermoguttaceae bacterium]
MATKAAAASDRLETPCGWQVALRQTTENRHRPSQLQLRCRTRLLAAVNNLDTPEDVVKAFDNRISLDDADGTIIQGGHPKPKRIGLQKRPKLKGFRPTRWKRK